MRERKENELIIFDTTLRDGEQSPGGYMDTSEKIMIAEKLASAGVNVIEAGFPASSPGDYEAVREIASQGYDSTIAALCRATRGDIKAAGEALEPAIIERKGRIHTFIASSDVHVEGKLKKTFDEVCKMARDAVRYARTFTDDVEFSAEDAARTPKEKLARLVTEVIEAGATTVNVPDTVGYAMPHEIYQQFRYLFNNVPNINQATISFHGHGDLLNHEANTMAAIRAGARQVEVTVNGIGERAGNCPLEVVIGHLIAREDIFRGIYHTVNSKLIAELSQIVSSITGIRVQPHWPINGENAFSHLAGIHQHGITCDPRTYEIMRAEDFGYLSQLIIGARSGKAGVKHKFATEFGIILEGKDLDNVTQRIIEYCEEHKIKKMMDDELLIAYEGKEHAPKEFEFGRIEYRGNSRRREYSATVYMTRKKETRRGEGRGIGSIDAAINATRNAMHELNPESNGLEIKGHNSVSARHGTESNAVYTFIAMYEGHALKGRGIRPDTVEAAAIAYIDMINRAQFMRGYVRA